MRAQDESLIFNLNQMKFSGLELKTFVSTGLELSPDKKILYLGQRHKQFYHNYGYLYAIDVIMNKIIGLWDLIFYHKERINTGIKGDIKNIKRFSEDNKEYLFLSNDRNKIQIFQVNSEKADNFQKSSKDLELTQRWFCLLQWIAEFSNSFIQWFCSFCERKVKINWIKFILSS